MFSLSLWSCRNFSPRGSIRQIVLLFSLVPSLPPSPPLISEFEGRVPGGAQASSFLDPPFGAGSPQVMSTHLLPGMKRPHWALHTSCMLLSLLPAGDKVNRGEEEQE